ncbi:MAG: hypothetical protein ACE5DX_06115, partial [Candidatus Dojkabacteria bacterium]
MDPLRDFFSNKRNLYLVYGALIAGVLIVLVTIVFIVTRPREDESDDQLSVQEQRDILNEVIVNNPQDILDLPDEDLQPVTPGVGGSAVDPNVPGSGSFDIPADLSSPVAKAKIPVPRIYSTGETEELSPQDLVAPDINVYNYRHTTTSITPGPANGSCPNYDITGPQIEEYFEYFDENHSFYKAITNTRGRLTNYYLGKYGNDIDEYYTYIGGDLAARLLFDIYEDFDNTYQHNPDSNPGSSYPSSYPNSYPVNPVLRNIYKLFGDDARITDVDIVGGKTFYDVTTASYISCDAHYYHCSAGQRVVNIYRIDGEDFSIVEKKRFLGEVLDENLLSTEVIEREVDKVHLNQVVDEFNFEFDVKVQTVNYSDYEYDARREAQRDINHLRDNNIELLAPESEMFQIGAIHGKDFPERVKGEDYYKKRSFYPRDSFGQKLFDEQKRAEAQEPLLSIYYAHPAEYGYVTVRTWDSDSLASKGIDLFEDTVYYDPFRSIVKKVASELSINSRQEVVDKYVINYPTYSYRPLSYPGSYPVSYPNSYGWYTYNFFDVYAKYSSASYDHMLNNYNVNANFLETQDWERFSAKATKF